ncbi:hypothetical protein L211DRAFT_351032 [Terfezia boudieri ATCC MYA-4762]|uniref:HNH nuclease domain-containing protein n=1 Tax=Terfezia boudieri ATCC MYA-4762 TaxID=1051890 RepID=A0A3N4LGX1_9PEZI|nr:hypothetical protein L211DRAFT_351032 [Terfezia boudieri ATCC MYA-4762]
MSLVRPPHAWDAAPAVQLPDFLGTDYITICHPGYLDGGYQAHIIVRLPAYDKVFLTGAVVGSSSGSNSSQWGVHHGLVLWACQILACNAQGFLSTTKPRDILANGDANDWDSVVDQHTRNRDLDSLLVPDIYYFYTTDRATDIPYPICSSFRDWMWPAQIPPEWHQPGDLNNQPRAAGSTYVAEVRGRDRSCRITGFSDAGSVAHLIPLEEADWFVSQGMSLFNLNQRLSLAYITSDVLNCLLLRDDIHRVFDNATFVIVPKNGKYVSHFLEQTTNLGHLYHNCETWELGVRAEFLYARFAWAVLQLHDTFVATHKHVSDQSPPSGEDDNSGRGGSHGRGRRGRGRSRGRRSRGGDRSGKGHAAPQRSSERLKLKERERGKGKPNASISLVEAWKKAYPGLGLYPRIIVSVTMAELSFL